MVYETFVKVIIKILQLSLLLAGGLYVNFNSFKQKKESSYLLCGAHVKVDPL